MESKMIDDTSRDTEQEILYYIKCLDYLKERITYPESDVKLFNFEIASMKAWLNELTDYNKKLEEAEKEKDYDRIKFCEKTLFYANHTKQHRILEGKRRLGLPLMPRPTEE